MQKKYFYLKRGLWTNEQQSRARIYQASQSAILVLSAENSWKFVFIVAVFIKKINKTMNHNAFVLKERKDLIQARIELGHSTRWEQLMKKSVKVILCLFGMVQ